MHGLVTVAFGDAEHDFRLTLAGLAAIEEKFDKSVFVIAASLQLRTAKSSEIAEVIRWGLIGAGTKPVEALALVRRWVDERPLDESRDVALAVALAGLARVHSRELAEVDEPGELQPMPSPNGSTSELLSERPL